MAKQRKTTKTAVYGLNLLLLHLTNAAKQEHLLYVNSAFEKENVAWNRPTSCFGAKSTK